MNKARWRAVMLCMLAAGVVSHAQAIKRTGQGFAVEMTPANRADKTVTFKLGDYRLGSVQMDGQTFSTLTAGGRVNTNRKGYAELPFFHTALQLAPDKQYRAVVLEADQDTLTLEHPLLPSRGPLNRKQNPNEIPFLLAESADREGYFPANLVTLSEPFVYRDVKGQNLYFNAAQYDAGTRTLKLTKRMTVRLEEVDHCNEDCQSLMTRANVPPAIAMDKTYQSLFLNYEPASTRWPHELGEEGDILVITTARDKAAIQPYVEHKQAAGFNVEVKELTKGTDVKATIKAAYEANKKLLYVQLVGGWNDLKVPKGTKEKQPMDPTVGWITNDHYPELIIGRFCGNSAADITAQVNKTIAYEQDTEEDWVKRGIGIASSEGAGQGDDGESDIEHMTNIRDGRLIPAGYTTTDFHGDKSKKQAAIEAWNKGLSIVNYVGHGSPGGWGTTRLSIQDAKVLKNGHKAPIVCSVACDVGNYTQNCFAEAMLKSPGGAIAGMFSTIGQDWVAPMRGQDYFNDLLVGGHQYKNGKEKGTDTDHGKERYGALAANACILMYAESSQTNDLETIQTWANFGDVSLKVHKPKASQ